MAFGIYVTFSPKAKLATKVIAALGFDNPANVSTSVVNQEARERWEQENGKPFPSEQYDDYAIYY